MESSQQSSWKRLFSCFISLNVYCADRVANFLSRAVGRSAHATSTILYYHSVPAEQRCRFAKQLDVLLRCVTPIALDHAKQLHRAGHCVAITFDDGFENFYSVALPELNLRSLPSTVFVISEAVGKTFGRVGQMERVMTVQQLRALPKELVLIGSHTASHRRLTDLAESDAREELIRSKMQLSQMLEREISLFSFPFGAYNSRLVELCSETGYDRVFTTIPELASCDESKFAMGRVRVDPTDWPLEFRLKLAGAYRWLPLMIALKRKVIPLFSAVVRRDRSLQESVSSHPSIR